MFNRQFVLLILAIGVALGVGCIKVGYIFYAKIDPTSEAGLTKLRSLIYSFSPVVEKLHQLENSQKELPDHLENLNGLPEHFLTTFPLLHLSNHGESFTLYYKLDWDSSLRYDSLNRSWSFDPGDGNPEIRIRL
ncbi:MAG: hypothetical protein CMO55_26855 [Verrucomicrobiales bacterium]|nr:hypothetical protein [Verrucomicrobiales bacterium]